MRFKPVRLYPSIDVWNIEDTTQFGKWYKDETYTMPERQIEVTIKHISRHCLPINVDRSTAEDIAHQLNENWSRFLVKPE